MCPVGFTEGCVKVYHGTSLTRWNLIKNQGLLPRGKSKKSNWTHSIESNPETVYLTDAYALYFALETLNQCKGKFDNAVIIEMDTDNLPGTLVPDEDALEQVARRSDDGLPPSWSMKERTRHYRGMTKEYAKHGMDFFWSLQVLGTGGHIGKIDPKFFSRIAIIDIKKEAALSWAFMDTQVSVMNYKYLGSRWRFLSKKIFGDSYEDIDPLSAYLPYPEFQGGIEVINLSTETV